eukprot:5068123-Pyramimonas_sp.AAC.1
MWREPGEYSDPAPLAFRNYALAWALQTMSFRIALSLETFFQFVQESRFSNPPARTGRVGPPSRPSRWGLHARSARLVLPRDFCSSPLSC